MSLSNREQNLTSMISRSSSSHETNTRSLRQQRKHHVHRRIRLSLRDSLFISLNLCNLCL
jgi:hypothetical protein